MKIAVVAVWVVAAIAFLVGISGDASMASRVTLALVGIMPPLVMWFWWHAPSPTMSESIQQARDGDTRG